MLVDTLFCLFQFNHIFIWFEQYSSGHKGYKNTNISVDTEKILAFVLTLALGARYLA